MGGIGLVRCEDSEYEYTPRLPSTVFLRTPNAPLIDFPTFLFCPTILLEALFFSRSSRISFDVNGTLGTY